MRKLHVFILALFALGLSACDGRKEEIETEMNRPISKFIVNQLEKVKENLTSNMPEQLQLLDYQFSHRISSSAKRKTLIDKILNNDSWFAAGVISDQPFITVGLLESLGSRSNQSRLALRTAVEEQVRIGDDALELQWRYGENNFKTICVVSDSGIRWDNVISNLLIIEHEEEDSHDATTANCRTYDRFYQGTWRAFWLWGSQRGEMGYRITIHCNSSPIVVSTDRTDWATMTVGNAQSESRILKNSGTYGKIGYALGMGTPLVSVTFNSSSFTVSVSGVGSNVVSNGTKTLLP